jgi:2-polyprenyl-3-methyl-5-hydroxy-6-metoxy-1,4-benzoquinol methylase
MSEPLVDPAQQDQATVYRARVYRRYVSDLSRASVLDSAALLQPRLPYLRKVIRDHFPVDRAALVLDLGCGHGALLHAAQKEGYRNVEGVDGSPEQVALAAGLEIGGVRRQDVLEALAGMAAGSRDVVVAFDVIEHFRKEELLVLVDGVRRVLRPGGRWIIHAPNGESPFVGRTLYGDFTHEMAFTRESISQVLLASGFARVECYEDAPVPHGLYRSIRWVLWKAIRVGLRLWLAVETGDPGRDAIFTQGLLAVATNATP